MPNAAARFAAGAAGVLTGHQAVVWALHREGVVPWPAYSFAATRPFGVPHVLSAAFWGGVWWVALSPVVERAASPGAYWARAATLGAVLPTAVGALLVATGRGAPRGNARPATLLAAGLGVNAAWGVAAAVFVGLMLARSPDTALRTARRSRV